MSFDALDNSSVRYSSRLLITSLAFEFNVKTGSGQGVMVYSGIVVGTKHMVLYVRRNKALYSHQ